MSHAESTESLGRRLARHTKNAELRWPTGFMDIGDWTFARTYAERPEWVEFTLDGMETPSGLFKTWQEFCQEQSKASNAKPVQKESS